MITLHQLDDTSAIDELKAAYLAGLTAPLDGMWEAFADAAVPWEIRGGEQRVGFYVVDREGTLLLFHVAVGVEQHAPALFRRVIDQDAVNKAMVATIDPLFLALCLDVHERARVHTLLYELRDDVEPSPPPDEGLEFRLAAADELGRVIAFQQACLADTRAMGEWLRGYSSSLIERKELFVLCRDDDWIGVGECRRSDSQRGVADLGVMVAPKHRAQGRASEILRRLARDGRAAGLRLICSTTVENLAAQKAVARAGFSSRHRLLEVTW